jgi:hypothetical protein
MLMPLAHAYILTDRSAAVLYAFTYVGINDGLATTGLYHVADYRQFVLVMIGACHTKASDQSCIAADPCEELAPCVVTHLAAVFERPGINLRYMRR